MTNADYKATPEQWAFLRDCAANGPTPLRDQSAAQNSCLLELRARVEALEEAQQPAPAPAPASSLVERVADALADEFQPSGTWHDEARAAIREVAGALRAKDSKHWDPSGVAQMVTWEMVAQWLEQDAGQ